MALRGRSPSSAALPAKVGAAVASTASAAPTTPRRIVLIG